MQYQKFLELINNGETAYVDYKISCNAFDKSKGDKEKANVELIKDIIAMANNGNKASYLIIGVSDDGKQFESVINDALADDNIQRLCRDYIYPIPKVQLKVCQYNGLKIRADLRAKRFKIIQIGPQSRQCFRFNVDRISYKDSYAYKKHEVWLRRGKTSDLASPEEIKKLLDGKEPFEQEFLGKNTQYDTLPRKRSRWDFDNKLSKKDEKNVDEVILEEFTEKIRQLGGEVTKILPPGEKAGTSTQPTLVAAFKINEKTIKLAIIIGHKTTKGIINNLFRSINIFCHGVLLISTANLPTTSAEYCYRRFSFPWGWFALPKRNTNLRNFGIFDEYGFSGSVQPFCIALKNIKTTQSLERSLGQAIKTTTENSEILNLIVESYSSINTEVSSLLKKPMPSLQRDRHRDISKNSRRRAIQKFLDK